MLFCFVCGEKSTRAYGRNGSMGMENWNGKKSSFTIDGVSLSASDILNQREIGTIQETVLEQQLRLKTDGDHDSNIIYLPAVPFTFNRLSFS